MKPRQAGAASREHAKHSKKTVISVFGRTCNDCSEFKGWTKYYLTASSYTGHEATCKACRCIVRRDRYKPVKRRIVDEAMINSFLQGRMI